MPSPDASHQERACAAPSSLGSWQTCHGLLSDKIHAYEKSAEERQVKHANQLALVEQSKQALADLQEQVRQEEVRLKKLEEQEQVIAEELNPNRLQVLQTLFTQCNQMATAEDQQHDELHHLLSQQPLRSLNADQMDLVWWRAGLDVKKCSALSTGDITGSMAVDMDVTEWLDLGLSHLHACRVKFTLSMLDQPGPRGLSALQSLTEEDCAVCNSCSWTTWNFLHERGIKLKRNNFSAEWTTPLLIYAHLTKVDIEVNTIADYLRTVQAMKELKRTHVDHLSELSKQEHYDDIPGSKKRSGIHPS